MQRSAQRTGRLVIVAVAVGFSLLVAASAATALLMARTQTLSDRVAQTYEVETAISNLQLYVERTEIGRRSYLIDPRDFFVDIFERNRELVRDGIVALRGLTGDNPVQQQRLNTIARLWDEHVLIMQSSMRERAAGGATGSATPLFDESNLEKVRDLRRIATDMVETERQLLAERRSRQALSESVSYAVLVITGIVLVVLAAFTITSTRRSLRQLAETGERLALLNDDLEAAVQVRTQELKQANEEIQRFAYIVSHDLRSPLVNVMGFTSELDAALKPLGEMIERADTDAPGLVSEDTRLAVKEDLPEAIGFIRSSTQKMDRLINAILRLSREGRRVLAPEPLEMTAIVGGIVDTLQHRLTEGGVEIAVDPLPNVVSDRVAIEQILSNLIENSVKYLKPGRPGRITVSGQRRAGRVVYEVADNGRGIDPKDHQRIFDLFRRSGTQDQPGEGIGLAHVRALAYRLGGIVECESTLGEGATFRVSLPPSLRPEAAA